MLTSASCNDPRLREELRVAIPIGSGASAKARIVQELLCLSEHRVVVDGVIGPATLAALAEFCTANGLKVASAVDQTLMDALAQPILQAISPVARTGSLGATAIQVARRHIANRPREVGGQNSSAWVRLYMDGKQGAAWPWCAGFVTYVLRAAATIEGIPLWVPRTYSCDTIGAAARTAGKLKTDAAKVSPPPGSLFLIPKGGSSHDWEHVGFVADVNGGSFVTLEGNTNDDGSREGYEAVQRRRAPANVDLVLL